MSESQFGWGSKENINGRFDFRLLCHLVNSY